MTDINSDKNADTLKDFWKELARALELPPTRDGMEDVFSEYQGMHELIEADAAGDSEHGKMLARALAIRDSST
jgi:hypothetical protein